MTWVRSRETTQMKSQLQTSHSPKQQNWIHYKQTSNNRKMHLNELPVPMSRAELTELETLPILTQTVPNNSMKQAPHVTLSEGKVA